MSGDSSRLSTSWESPTSSSAPPPLSCKEHQRAIVLYLDGLQVKVLPLARVIASKRAAGRPKDLAVRPALEATLAVLHESDRDT